MIPRMAMPLLSGFALFASIWWTTGPAGLIYALIFAAAVAPGIPLGVAIFGRGNPSGWIAGALVGYGTTQLALWAAIAAGMPTPLGFVASWTAQAVLLVVAARRSRSPDPQPAVRLADVPALARVLLLVPALMGPPYRNIGIVDSAGTKHYRAYFTADFVWHTALAAEIGKHAMPPRNPYLAPKTIHYYWTYFLLPAVVAHDGPAPLRDVQRDLKVNAICAAVLVIGALFCFVRLAVPAAWPAVTAVWLGVVAASAEGAWALTSVVSGRAPLDSVTDLNIDALTAWRLNGLRIDCLPRSLWYNPQHSMACALALAAVTAAASGAANRVAVTLFAGVALALATCLNPFVGAVFSVIFGLSLVWQAVVRERTVSQLLRDAVAAVPVGFALAWCALNQITSGAGTSMHFGLLGLARHHPVATLLMSAGPVLIPSIAVLWRRDTYGVPAVRTAVIGALFAIGLLYFVRLGDDAWIGFRAGQILLLMLPVLLARFLWTLRSRPAGPILTAAVVALILVCGVSTTLIDEFNAQDVHNTHMGSGFRWTVTLSRAQQEALDWIRTRTAETAVVQMEPIVRGRDEWSLIPSFAERRMAAGEPISLLAVPDYAERSQQIKRLFQTDDAAAAANIARHWHISYVYADATDFAAYPAGVEKFARAPQYFEVAFQNAEAIVYRVR